MEGKVLKRVHESPCGTCSEDCEVPGRPAVFCDQCSMWYHADCQQLNNKQMEVLGNDVPQDFVCSSCSQPNGNFD